MPMHADTQTITLPVSSEEAFAFLAEPENLARWAVGFPRGIRREGGCVDRSDRSGEVPVRVVADAVHGTIDFHMSVAPGLGTVAYSRVVPNDSGAEDVFTQFHLPGMAEEVFAAHRLGDGLALHAFRGAVLSRRARGAGGRRVARLPGMSSPDCPGIGC